MNSYNQSDTMPSELNQNPFNMNKNNEAFYHSSKNKRPVLHFNVFEQKKSYICNTQDLSQHQSMNTSTISQNLFENRKNCIANNNELNLFNRNKSLQQEKYDAIKMYCSKKNDSDSYPLISYENFLLIDSLCEKNIPELEKYKNFLFNKEASIEIYVKFCTLLMTRYISSGEK